MRTASSELPDQLAEGEPLRGDPDRISVPYAEQDDEHPADDADEPERGKKQERDHRERPDDDVGGRTLGTGGALLVVRREGIGVDAVVLTEGMMPVLS